MMFNPQFQGSIIQCGFRWNYKVAKIIPNLFCTLQITFKQSSNCQIFHFIHLSCFSSNHREVVTEIEGQSTFGMAETKKLNAEVETLKIVDAAPVLR